jgi:hypothetical protein
MADTMTRQQRILANRVLIFDFHAEEGAATLGRLRDLFDALNDVLNIYRTLNAYPSGGPPGTANHVVTLQMQSPLKIKVSLFKVPKEAVDAILSFFNGIIFYREERSRRAAMAASEWENVYAKRLRNIDKAGAIATGQGDRAELTTSEVERLLRASRTLEQSPMQLTQAHIEDEPSGEQSSSESDD